MLAQSGERQRLGKRRLREGKRTAANRRSACGRGMGRFVLPARVTFFFCKKKVTKENHLDLRSKDPLARYGSCRFGGVYSRAGCSGHHCRSKGLCLRSPARRLPRPLAPATVGVFASTGLAEFRRCGGESVSPLTGRRPPAATFLSAKKEMWKRKSLRPTV